MTRSKGIGRGNAPGSQRALRKANAKRQAQATKARPADGPPPRTDPYVYYAPAPVIVEREPVYIQQPVAPQSYWY